MPKQRIYSVHQRATGSPGERELGVFTDPAMADQAIDYLYRYAWNDISSDHPNWLWFDADTVRGIKEKGRDTWITDEKNAVDPIFFKRPHDLWNQVPPSAEDFHFSQEVVDGGSMPVIEEKKKF